MGLLRLSVLGPPEVLYNGSRLTFSLRKAQALLLYLAVEGGMHPRSKLAALLWPDSELSDALKALRNSLTLLRRLLADPDTSPAQHSHLLFERDLVGLNPQAEQELDLDVVQHAWQEAQELSTFPSLEQRASLVAHVQNALALVRGPFLDGFWLREEVPFDEWVQQEQRQWQVRLQLLCERLSSWHETAGELEQARDILTRWLALDPLSEEAYRRLMRVHLALGDASAALQVYAICRVRLDEELGVQPSAETVALADHIRASATRRGSSPARSSPAAAENRPPGELVAPLVGRAAAFTQLTGRYQQARGGQPQAVLLVGEAGIGKTRLAREFVAWARAQGAEVLSGQAFEMGGRLPYQPLVEAIRPRLENENAPEDLLDDLWLAELSRILPELRVRYPDLPALSQDELAAKVRLFEAVARLVDALAQRGPLVLLLDDLHWVDGASLDLVRYLGRYWKGHSSRVLLLGTARSEGLELNPELTVELADLGRDLPVTQVTLQTLSQAETLQLVQAIAGEGEHGTRSGGERNEHVTVRPSTARPGASPAPERETKLSALGNFLFVHTSGQPLYLLETLKMLREREWLVPRLGADGSWRLEPTVDMAADVGQERSRRELLPPSVRALIQARLAPLSPTSRQLVMASAVLGAQATAQRLWQVAELGVQEGVEALEEAVGSGMLREQGAGGGRPGNYSFAHGLIRDVVYTELGQARRQVLHQRTLALLQTEGARPSELAYQALAAGDAEAAYRYSVQAADEAMAVFAVEDAIGHYEQARALLQEQRQLQTMLSAPVVEHVYVYLERAYAFLNAWEKAQEAYEELLAYAQQQHVPRLVSMTLNRLAILAVQQSNDKPKVRALLEEAWQMAEASHDQRALAETEWTLAQITALVWEDPKSALPHGEHALEMARGIHHQELEARSLSLLGVIHMLKGDFEEAMHSLEASLALYAALRNEQSASQELSAAHFLSVAASTQGQHHTHQTASIHPIAYFLIGAPPTRYLTNRATETLCWGLLALVQVNVGQVHNSIRSGRMALALSKEIKNVWAQINSTHCLIYGLLETGAYEEGLVLTQEAIALARALPTSLNLQLFLTALGSTYQALQQWKEAHRSFEEAVAIAETLERGPSRVPPLSQLCMNYALAGEWEQAYRYALEAIALRKSHGAALLPLDFYSHYETEALLRGGDEGQAREEVQRLGERLGPYRRFRIPYLRSLAALAAWDGQREQAIGHLSEADQLAAEIGLPGERWQIQAVLGKLYKAEGEQAQARTAFAESARIIQELAEGIGDEEIRSRFLAGPPIQQILQHQTPQLRLYYSGFSGPGWWCDGLAAS
jgi:DNA-binding SARP family transcriptional activator/predicted ATPase